MQTILVRVNLDIEGEVSENALRLKDALKTVKSLSKSTNKIVLLSHRGRPKGYDPKLSLEPLKEVLEKHLRRRITFFTQFDFPKIKKTIEQAPAGSIFLLENLRFLPGETKNSLSLAKKLASLGGWYINDDFATSHHANASNVALPKLLPHRVGPILKKEVDILKNVMKKPARPLVLIVGGAKASDKLKVIKHLLKEVDYVLLAGGPGNTALRAKGMNVKKSIHEPKMIKEVKKLLKSDKIIAPLDWLEYQGSIVDIGPKTIERYSEIVKKAKTIIWGGPLGAFEDPKFRAGSEAIAREVALGKAFTVVGGGETTELILQLGLENEVDLLSSGGGAMLAFLAGEKLPALETLGLQNE